jgi:hypothetical protein
MIVVVAPAPAKALTPRNQRTRPALYCLDRIAPQESKGWAHAIRVAFSVEDDDEVIEVAEETLQSFVVEGIGLILLLEERIPLLRVLEAAQTAWPMLRCGKEVLCPKKTALGSLVELEYWDQGNRVYFSLEAQKK